jgi:superoxide reductase
MENFGSLFQTADWKTEKHVPAITCPDEVPAGQYFEVRAEIGKEIGHPNTTEHHIAWIKLYFHPEGDKYPYEIGHFQLSAHGGSAQGPNTSGVYTNHAVIAQMKTEKPGHLFATSYCNIHGMWLDTKQIKVQQAIPAPMVAPAETADSTPRR